MRYINRTGLIPFAKFCILLEKLKQTNLIFFNILKHHIIIDIFNNCLKNLT